MSENFGLDQSIEVKFFTAEEAKAIPGVKPGLNAVHRISETRVRYELLKPMKTGVVAPVEEVSVPVSVEEVVDPVAVPEQATAEQVVDEEKKPTTKKKKEVANG